ncbi:PTS sugar transporter subunit IIA [Georgenia sp. Z1344]|uniref:PTS sugar transporter subunit IIA n=1 Tax=Georgenia sp. Z1344 TaxID=3416706 RepID=UPI003CEF63A9
MMLSTLLTDDRITFADTLGWEEAIRRAAAPLVADGSVDTGYVDQIVTNVNEPGGTYMDLGFGITLAHARPEAGVNRTSVALLLLARPTELADSPDHPVRAVVVLGATDSSSHQDTLADIAAMLTDEERRGALLSSTTHAQVRAVVDAA